MKIVNRIRKNNDFSLAIKKGHSNSNDSFVIYYLKTDLNHSRVGISVSKKVGNAVVRNHIKRQIRAICDSLIEYNQSSFDVVIIARKSFNNYDFQKNKELLSNLLTFIGGTN